VRREAFATLGALGVLGDLGASIQLKQKNLRERSKKLGTPGEGDEGGVSRCLSTPHPAAKIARLKAGVITACRKKSAANFAESRDDFPSVE